MKANTIQFTQPHKTCTCGAPKPKLAVGIRRLKVQEKYTRNNYDVVPSLLLAGKWLDKIGFKPSSYVRITEKEGKLVISLEENDV